MKIILTGLLWLALFPGPGAAEAEEPQPALFGTSAAIAYPYLFYGEDYASLNLKINGQMSCCLSVAGTLRPGQLFLPELLGPLWLAASYEFNQTALVREPSSAAEALNHSRVALDAFWIWEWFPGTLEVALGLGGYWDTLFPGGKPVPGDSAARARDILDAGRSRFGVGPRARLGLRPLPWLPHWQVQTEIGYSPLGTTAQELFPRPGLWEFGLATQYDWHSVLLRLRYLARFQTGEGYLGHQHGLQLAVGYLF